MESRAAVPCCPKHAALRQEYYCCECNELLCRRCMMDGHRLHDYEESETVAERTTASLQELLEKCPQSISTAVEVGEQLDKSTKTLSESRVTAAEAMNAFFCRLRSAIDDREKLLSDALTEYGACQTANLKQMREKIAAAQEVVQAALGCPRKRAEGAIDSESLAANKQLVSSLEASQEAICEVSQLFSEGKTTATLSFHFNQAFTESIPELGKIVEAFTKDGLETERDLSVGKQTESSIEKQPEKKQSVSHMPPLRISSMPTFSVSPPPTKVRTRSTAIRSSSDTDPVEVVFCGSKSEAIYPYGIAMGVNDLIIVTDLRSNSVQVIANTGKVIDNIGKKKGTNPFKGPCDVAVGTCGGIFILEGEGKRIRKFFNGNLMEVGQKLRKEFQDPRGIAVTRESIYITDWAKNCIHILDINGKLVKSIGDDFLKQPTGITVTPSGNLLVADQENSCIWEIKEDGRIIRPIGGDKGSNPGQLNLPYGVTLDSQGRVIVTEKGNCRVSIFSPNGQFVTCFGSKGQFPGQFNVPRHVCVNSSGQIVVADEQNQRIQIFDI